VRSTAAHRTGLISALARVRLILRPAPCEHEFQDFGLPLPRTTNDPVPARKHVQASQLLQRRKICRSCCALTACPVASGWDSPQPLSLPHDVCADVPGSFPTMTSLLCTPRPEGSAKTDSRLLAHADRAGLTVSDWRPGRKLAHG